MSSTLSHEELEILIAADALDGLDEADRERLGRLMATHGPECPECRRLVVEYREVAGRVAMALGPEALSAGAEDALVAAARARQPSTGRGPFLRPARRWIGVAAVAAAIAVLAGVVGYVLAPGQAGLRTVTLRGTAPGQVTLVYQPGRTDAILLASGIPNPGLGKVYELWYQPASGAAMRPAGVFNGSGGSAVIPVSVGRSFVLVAVTVEPGPKGSPHPTTNPILSASV